MKEKILRILAVMRSGVYERDEALGLSLLSALAGESMFLLGLPGVGKSMIARRLKLAFQEARVFEYLMSRFSTPDEIFGPVSISKLKDEDCYERVTQGYLPEAEVVFLDEIWKAGPAIQNSLLTVLNEKIYLNGNREMSLPLKGVIAASNELPAKDEGLEALWDRFMIRYVVEPIISRENFFRLLSSSDKSPSMTLSDSDEPAATSVQDSVTISVQDSDEANGRFSQNREKITASESQEIRERSGKVAVPEKILETIYRIRETLNGKIEERDVVTGEVNDSNRQYYVSDRRWRKATGILRTSAYLNGRDEVDFSDVLLLCHILWNEDSAIPVIRQTVAETVVSMLFRDLLEKYKSYKRHASTQKDASIRLYSPDSKHYVIDCEGAPMKIKISDYDKINSSPNDIYFGSETADGRIILKNRGQYALRKAKDGCICINNYTYPLRTISDNQLSLNFLREIGDAVSEIANNLYSAINHNIFLASSDICKPIQAVVGVYKERFDQGE